MNRNKPVGIDINSIKQQSAVQLVQLKAPLISEEIIEYMIRLSLTLDLEVILREITHTIQKYITIDSLYFENDSGNYPLQIGKQAEHSFSYQLIDENNIKFAQINVSRSNPFNEQEVNLFEELICYAMFAIKNSLNYQEALEYSLTDPLTKVSNRRALDNSLDNLIQMSKRHQIPFSMIALDIDNFKKINDEYGHLVADRLLQNIAQTLKQSMRNYDELFRSGGDEFIILLKQCPITQSQQSTDRLCKTLGKKVFNVEEHTIQVNASFGLAHYHFPQSSEDLMKAADAALYQAKKQGKNRVYDSHSK